MRTLPKEEFHTTTCHFYVCISENKQQDVLNRFFTHQETKFTFDSSASGAVHLVLHLIFSVVMIFPFSFPVVSTNFARPKSDTFAVLSSAINTLLAATSRWTI